MSATQSICVDIELEASVSAKSESWDYGVPRSPTFTDMIPDDWADCTVDIAGVTCRLDELPIALRKALWDCAMEGIDDAKWEMDDDYDG